MKLTPGNLKAHLAKKTLPVYLIHGDEPYQIMMAADTLREHASQTGHSEREVIQATEDQHWGMFRETVDSQSLFAEKRVVDLRLPTGKPGRAGGAILKSYCERPADDVFLLITSGKLDRSATQSAWYKAVDKLGAVLPVWPIPVSSLNNWLRDRLHSYGMTADADALALIAERVEGNMLAANQEIERLALLHPQKNLSVADVLSAVADSARYSIADLAPAALQGDVQRVRRILTGLRDEAVTPVLVLWALSQEIRAGTRVAEAYAEGANLSASMKAAGVWQKRVGPLTTAIHRHPVASWLRMLSTTSRIDRMIKGQERGDVWDALDALCTELATTGGPVISKQAL